MRGGNNQGSVFIDPAGLALVAGLQQIGIGAGLGAVALHGLLPAGVPAGLGLRQVPVG